VVLSIEERVFLFECVFREGNRYTDLVQEEFAEKFPETPVPHHNWGWGGAAKSAVYRDRPRKLNVLKIAITVYIRNILQADLQKMFATKMDITSNTFYKCTATFRKAIYTSKHCIIYFLKVMFKQFLIINKSLT